MQQPAAHADTHWECPDPGGFCAIVLPPGPEDTEHASMDVVMGLNGGIPATLLDVDLHSDPFTGLPDLWPPQVLSQAATFAAGTSSIDVAVEVFAETGATTQFPYADFLNSAELDGGATGLGSFMVFGADGTVTLPSGDLLFRPRGAGAPDSRIVYSPFAPVGTRYTVEFAQKADPRSFEDHPVNHVSWLGAVKFCNWLTLNQGLAPAERCYTEGPGPHDWHPATISTADWATRDARRARAARARARGLPAADGRARHRDRLGREPGAALQRAVQGGRVRSGRAGDRAQRSGGRDRAAGALDLRLRARPLHGRRREHAPERRSVRRRRRLVALYDGTTYNAPGMPAVGNGSVFASAAGANPWGIHDLSGNVAEWIQDRVPGQGMAVRGGSWSQLFAESAATWRDGRPVTDATPWLGFRVVQSMPMKALPAPGPAPTPVTFP